MRLSRTILSKMLLHSDKDESLVVWSLTLRADAGRNLGSYQANFYGASLLTRARISAKYQISNLWSLEGGSSSTPIFLLVDMYSSGSYLH